jgi:mevalonate kinase
VSSTPVGPAGSVGLACGKVIFLGEHAVVYGIPAVAVGIERGVRAVATPIERGPTRLSVGVWGVEIDADDERDLGRALRALVEVSAAAGVEAPVHVEAQVDLPPGGGLGCSAALGVATARAIDPSADVATITERVMAWERVFHGNPSGIDAAVAARGGGIMFTKDVGDGTFPASSGRGPHLTEPIRIGAPLTLCIGNSGTGSSTRAMVEAVAHLRERRPEIVHKSFEGIKSLVRNARLAIEAGDLFALGRLMDLNQMLLSGIFVSTTEIEQMCAIARAEGAFGAKLTGAGGGGCVVALVHGDAEAQRVLAAWKGAGYEGFATRVAAEGRSGQSMSESAP